MSHYSVAVLVENLADVEEMLAPYDSEIKVERYVEATKEELIAEEKLRIQKYADTTYAEYLKDPKAYEETHPHTGHIAYLKNEFPLKLTWNDEQFYKEAVKHYDDEEIGPNGEVYSTYNPKSKWDWYKIGGRYRDELLVKAENQDVLIYQPTEFDVKYGNAETRKAPEGYKWADAAKIKDICFDVMKAEEEQKSYEKAIRFWELAVEEKPLREGEERPSIFYRKEYYTERYGTKEAYAKICSTFHTYALLTEEGWFQKGEMAWFGLDNATKGSEEAFLEQFLQTIHHPDNQEKYLVVVDCHT